MVPRTSGKKVRRTKADRSLIGRAALDAHASSAAPNALREYAFIADGCRGALIGPNGDIAWMCFPQWADSAVFAGLLGSGGVFRIAPKDRYIAGGYYEDGSLIWRSRWVTEHGVFESREALVYPATAERAVLMRRVRAVEGSGTVIASFAPAEDYGRAPLGPWRKERNSFIAQNDIAVRLHVPPDVRVERFSAPTRLAAAFEVSRDDTFDFVVEFASNGELPTDEFDVENAWKITEESWKNAVPTCDATIAAADVRRSIAVLRGMTGPEGGTVAAATTSLPERVDSERNYDYRFCWIRDTCYIGQAGAVIPGGEVILDDAVRWVTARLLADKERLCPAYLGNGDPIFPPKPLQLPGYPGGIDVVGNRVREQFQLDIFGDVLLLFACAASKDRLDADGWHAAEIAIDAIKDHWNDLESGIWETEPNLYTHSRLICVAGLRAICGKGGPASSESRAILLADHILDATNSTSLHPTGRWQRAPDDDRVDASLLLSQVRGALSADDPRSKATRDAVNKDLAKDHYLYRYATDGQDLGDEEGAFLICNFWMALAELDAGNPLEAVRWFERGRAAMSTPGLFSEEFDTEEHQLRGNLPQAFVHAMFLEAAAAQGSQR